MSVDAEHLALILHSLRSPGINQASPSYATPADKARWPVARPGLQFLILTSVLPHPDRRTIALHKKRLRHDVTVPRLIIPGGSVEHKIDVTS